MSPPETATGGVLAVVEPVPSGPSELIPQQEAAPPGGRRRAGPGRGWAGGFFDADSAVPAKTEDPLAKTKSAAAKSENDATPYLP